MELSLQLGSLGLRRIVSSPHERATQSVTPLAERLGISVETDERLVERQVPFDSRLDWREYIRPTFRDLDLVLPNAESSRAAMARGARAVAHVIEKGIFPVGIATHGQLLTLLLMHLDGREGFDTWASMTNPDVFRVTLLAHRTEIERIWSDPPRCDACERRFMKEHRWVER